jgi:prepilin-type N-terminal cleavage/methylation domain-containing protein
MRRRPAGFTLIELLVVMAIVAVLLTIAVPRYFGSLGRSRDVALQENLKVLRVTLDKYAGDKGHFPDTLEDLVTQKYLRAVPIDPITESAQTWILIPANDGDTHGIADVKSGAPGMSAEGLAYAAF